MCIYIYIWTSPIYGKHMKNIWKYPIPSNVKRLWQGMTPRLWDLFLVDEIHCWREAATTAKSMRFHMSWRIHHWTSRNQFGDSGQTITPPEGTLEWYGYGSIPINTIFRRMNIHKSQLFWCELRGYKVLTHCHIMIPCKSSFLWLVNKPCLAPGPWRNGGLAQSPSARFPDQLLISRLICRVVVGRCLHDVFWGS